MAFNIAPFIPPVIFAVTIAFLGYFYGILVGLFFLFVSGYAFFFLGLGKIRTPVSSVEVRPAKPGQGAPRRKAGWEHKELHSEPFPGVATLYDVFQRGLRVNPDGKCYGYRPAPDADFKWLTYKEVDKRIKSHTAALISIGMEEQERLGFYTKNRIEWGILAEAANACNLVSVAIYDTLGEENRVFVVQQSRIKTILTSRQLLDNICSLAGECPELKNVILAGECEQVDRDKAEAAGLKLYTFDEFEELGARSPHQLRLPKPDDLAIIMYTSGTTSRPKGVMLSHRNVVGTVAGVLETVNFNETDRYLSYLPLAHILERAAECCVLVGGGATGFYQGDIRKLDADIKAVKPTIYCGVPKVFQRVMNTVLRKIHESPLYAQILFNTAYCIKRKFIETGLPTGLLDKIIFNKVKEGLGGEVRLLVSGGAPLAGECHEFLRVCFGCPVRQGYGLTETSGGATVVPAESVDPWEKAGCPMAACEIKLVDSGNYSSRHNPPTGEICVRGPNVTLGYYEMQDKTDEVFITEEDGERWFHTGDVGQWNRDGTLSIIGRTKDIFKLDGGEYIAPERLETKFAQCKLISNIFVYGDSKKSCLVAVVVPEFQAALAWAKANNVEVKDHFEPPNCPPSLCKNEDLKKQIQKDLDAMAAECKLQRYEYIVRLHLDPQFWTPETGLVTSALKNKRPQLFEHYEQQINEMYASVKE